MRSAIIISIINKVACHVTRQLAVSTSVHKVTKKDLLSTTFTQTYYWNVVNKNLHIQTPFLPESAGNDGVSKCYVTFGAPWHYSSRNFHYHHHHHKHQGLDPSIRSVSKVTAARFSASSVFQLFSFLVVCIGMTSKEFGFVAFFASVKASSVCIHLSCLVCL